jgi:carboxymethylenebutenolidase
MEVDGLSIIEEWVQYGKNNEYSGFSARLAGVKEPIPAVIVIQEIWGVDPHIQDVTRRLAGAGYAAFAPDLFSLDGSRPKPLEPEHIEAAKAFLNTIPPTAWRDQAEREEELIKLPLGQRTFIAETLNTLLGGINPENFIGHLTSAANFLRNEFIYSKGQGVASVGFCLGGALSAVLASSDPELKGAVVFYGATPSPERIAAITCPVLGFYGELDARLLEAGPTFATHMKAAGKTFEYHIYPQAHHAFFNDSRPSYQSSASRDAYSRLLGFFEKTLG